MALNSSRQWIPLQKQLVPRIKETSTTYEKNALRRHKDTIDAALRRGYLKYLDQDLILKTQADDERQWAATELQEVLRISLNRCHVQSLDDIAILSCAKLRICNLGSCYLRDINAFYGCISLLKLDVSNNQISQLPQSDFWSSLSSLRVLYLHGNGVSGRDALSRLNACSVLHILTLFNTPLALIKNYRHHVVNSILSLRALDHHVVSDEEIIENLHLSGSFQPLTKHFKLQLYVTCAKGTSYPDELSGMYSVLLAVDKVLARHSPVILVQRCIRGWLVRKALAKSNSQRIRALATRTRHNLSSTKPPPSQTNHGLVISAEIPLPRRTKDTSLPKKGKQHGPPAPPTSPYRRRNQSPLAIETHVIGMDEKSSRTKYFMHINLRKLQQTVTEAELLEPEGVDKNFRTAFKKTPPKSKSKGLKKNDPENKGLKRKECADIPKDTKRVQICEKIECNTVVQPDLNCDLPVEGVLVTGQVAPILPHDQMPDIATVKKEDGAEIRQAEKVILETVTKIKEPPRVLPKPHLYSKDELLFTRAATTMTLSTLRSVEQAHISKKKSETLTQKADLVSKVKQDRVIRKAKIENFHRKVREKAREWKNDEEHKLDQLKTKLEEKRNSDLLERSQTYDLSNENRLKQLNDETFAHEFGLQNTMVGSTLLKEDHKALKESETTEMRDVVREAREVEQEKQDMVKKYMALRRMKLLQEGNEARQKLDSKMLEAASNRMMASKRKIARETARKQAARDAIALTKEELRRGPQRPGESLPADQGPPVVTNEQGHPSPNRNSLEFKSPSHVRRMSREAHSSWQRGSKVMSASEDGHFPLINSKGNSPLMYGMMRPRSKKKSHVVLPIIDSELSSSATSSMIITRQLPVR